MNRTLVALCSLPLVVLTACGETEEPRTTAKQVAETCANGTSQLELSSDEKTIEYNFRPGSETAEAIYNCLLEESAAPSSVDFEVQGTRPIDGTQTAEWDGWKLLWDYDGDRSLMQLNEA